MIDLNAHSRKSARSSRRALMAGACLLAGPPLAPALAQTTAPSSAAASAQVEEVVVTAQRREENQQNVPIAVTAIGGAQLQEQGVQGSLDLTNVVPGLNFIQGLGIYGQPEIRSIGTTSHGPGVENPVATYIDGVYMASETGSLLSLGDVSQVAVLKGPQGTLFGRNATGGLIQVTTKAPSHAFSADLEGTAGNVGAFGESLYVTGGLTENLAANFAVSNDDQFQGFGRNLYTGQYVDTHRSVATRGKLLWQPDNQTDVTLSADYAKFTGAEPAIRAVSKTIFNSFMAGGPHDIALNVQPYSQAEQGGVSLSAKRDFGGVQLVSITAYRNDQVRSLFDADSTVAQILTIDLHQADRQFTQELQLLSTGDERLSWVTGAFFMSGDGKYNPLRTLASQAPGPIDITADTTVTSYAVFGQATYKIDEATNLTGGLRYSQDQRHLASTEVIRAPFGTITAAPPQNVSKTFGQPSWRVALDHRYSSELMVYASYNRGFRSGTFVPDLFPTNELKPEILDAYETGFKADLLDRRLRLNAAGFYYDYSNRQVLAILNGVEVVYGAEKAVSYGVDADLEYLATSNLSFTAGLSAIHARYNKFSNAQITALLPFGGDSIVTGSATGKALESTPDWTFNIGPTYSMPTSAGTFTASMNYYHNSGWFASPDNRERQPAYDSVAADLLWVPSFSNNLTIRMWGKNLTNAVYATQMTVTAFSDNMEVAPGRTYGVTLGLHF
jgi:iron complex outermembrane receptor protein